MTTGPKATAPRAVGGPVSVLVHRLIVMLRRLALGIVAATDGFETENSTTREPGPVEPIDHASAVGRWWSEVERGAPGFALALREQAGGQPPANPRPPRYGFGPEVTARPRKRVFNRLLGVVGGDHRNGRSKGPWAASTGQERLDGDAGGRRQGRGSTDPTEPESESVGDLTARGRVGFGSDGDDPRSGSDPTPPPGTEFPDGEPSNGHLRPVNDPNDRSWPNNHLQAGSNRWTGSNGTSPGPNPQVRSRGTSPGPIPQVRSRGTYLGTDQVSISFSEPAGLNRQGPQPRDETGLPDQPIEPPDGLGQPGDSRLVPPESQAGFQPPISNDRNRTGERATNPETSRPTDHSGSKAPSQVPQPVQWPSLPSPTAPLPLVESQFETKHDEEQMGVAPC